MHNNITAEYMKIFTAILEESTFLWGADTALKALGYLQADSQAENKQHTIKIIEYLNSKNITLNQLQKIKSNLAKLEYPPKIIDLIKLATQKEKLNYADLFQKCVHEYSRFNSLRHCNTTPADEFKNHDIRLHNAALQMQGKGLNILNLVYEQCKESFKNIANNIYELPESSLEPIPQPALALEKKYTKEEHEQRLYFINKLKEELKTNVIQVDFKKAINE